MIIWYGKEQYKRRWCIYEKIIMLVILAMTLVSCALSELNEARERRAERGVECYEKYNGNVYCKDREGNRY